MRRLAFVSAVVLMSSTVGGQSATAQEASGEGALAPEPAYEVFLPPEVMSDRLERVNTGGLTVEPGVRAIVGADIEAMRGRLFYVESGQIELTPMVDSPVWQDGVTRGGATGTVPGGEAVVLDTGELIFLPVIAPADVDPDATIGIANPGSEPAVLRGFHGHSGGGNDVWPEGVANNEGFVEARDVDLMDTLMADGAVFRSTFVTAPAGASVPLDDSALFTMVDVYEGKVKRTAAGPDGVTAPFWNSIKGGYLPVDPDWTFELVVDGDDPAVLNITTVLAAESAKLTE
jgi:hypothetical protein